MENLTMENLTMENCTKIVRKRRQGIGGRGMYNQLRMPHRGWLPRVRMFAVHAFIAGGGREDGCSRRPVPTPQSYPPCEVRKELVVSGGWAP